MVSRVVILLLLSLQLSDVESKNCKNGVKCVKIEECHNIAVALKLHASTVLIKLIQTLYCGHGEDNNGMICCPPNFELPSMNSSSSEQLSKNEALDLLPNKSVCGLQIKDKIIGGDKTNLDEHPWVAIIYCVTEIDVNVCCGGTLISSRYVMTAAHCVKTKDNGYMKYKVRLGEWDLSSETDCLGYECSPNPLDFDVEEAIVHENYKPTVQQHNDIAIMRLSQNVPFSDYIKPICLPLDSKLKEYTFESYDLEVAGWGLTEENIMSNFKLKVSVPVTNFIECHFFYKNYNITEKQLCAGGVRGKDSCKGDSGGALMGQIGSEQNWLAIGVVSFGSYPCGRPGWPGVYTRVTSYVDWILSKIRT